MKKWLRKWLGIEYVDIEYAEMRVLTGDLKKKLDVLNLQVFGHHPQTFGFGYTEFGTDGITDNIKDIKEDVEFIENQLDDLEKYLKIKRVTEKEKTYYRRTGK